MTSTLCPRAIQARFFPRRAALRRSCAAKEVSLVVVATWAISTKVLRSQAAPVRVLPLSRLAPLWELPGHMPTQEAQCRALGKRLRCVPI